MKQDLEKYLKTNRFKLDAEQPDDDSIWEGIREGMNKKRNILPIWFWKVSAIFIFSVFIGYYTINKINENKRIVVTLADISDDLGKQEAELKHLVNLKWETVKPLLTTENQDIQFLLDEMKDLDEVYKTYQNDLKFSTANEEIITALLDYYQKKMRILNRILHEIQKQNNHEKAITL